MPHLKSLIAATMECEICVQVYILCNHTCLHLLQKKDIFKRHSKQIPRSASSYEEVQSTLIRDFQMNSRIK